MPILCNFNAFEMFGAALITGGAITTLAIADDSQMPTNTMQGAAGEPDSKSKSTATGDWGGRRNKWEERGLSIGASWIGEGFGNFRGGKRTGAVAASTADLNLTIDTDKAFHWPSGKFYINLESHAGRNPSTDLTGDLQLFDQLNAAPYFQVSELYYEQKLFHEVLRIKMGKVDANTEFSVIKNGLSFLNSSAQVTPTILAFPTTPAPMPSVNLFFTPTKEVYAAFGVYLANRSDHFLVFTGSPWNVQPTRNGMLFIGETGVNWSRTPILPYDGSLKLGFWGHNGTFTRFNGSTQQGVQGFYAILDQTLWKPTEKKDELRGVRTFLEYGRTDPSVGIVYQHVGGGIAWKGPLSERPDDEVGFSPQYAYLSKQAGLPHSYELILESFYKAKITEWATLQPDLQYIIHPGGQYPNAVVATLRLTLHF